MARLLTTNLGLTATWSMTTGAAATGFPLTNLNSNKRGLVTRSTSTTSDKVYVATFTAATIKAVVLINYLNHSGGTIKAEYKNGAVAYANFGGGTGLFTVPTSNRTRLIALFDTTGVTATDVRISFLYGGAGTAYVELGVAFIGTYTQPTRGVRVGLSQRPSDPSIDAYALGGQKLTWARQKYLRLQTVYAAASETDKDSLQQTFDTVGRGTPIVYAVDPTDPDLIVYGYLGDLALDQVAAQGGASNWTVAVPFEEAR